MKVTSSLPLLFRGLSVFAILLAIAITGYKTRQYAIHLEQASERIKAQIAAERIETKIALERADARITTEIIRTRTALFEAMRDRINTRHEIIRRAAMAMVGEFVLVLGDSLVEGALLPERVCGIPILNGGVGGARASTLLPLLEDISVSAKPPKLVIIAVGVNNAATAYWDEHSFAASYSELLRKAMSISRVAVATTTPVDFSLDVGKTLNATARDDINNFIVATAEKFDLDVIHLDQLTTAGPLTMDGVHLSGAAKEIWLSRVMSKAASALGCVNEH
jgi:lysophospholipase L1-like esterase